MKEDARGAKGGPRRERCQQPGVRVQTWPTATAFVIWNPAAFHLRVTARIISDD